MNFGQCGNDDEILTAYIGNELLRCCTVLVRLMKYLNTPADESRTVNGAILILPERQSTRTAPSVCHHHVFHHHVK